MRFAKPLVVAMILGMPSLASAEPIAAALSATFCKCSLFSALSPSTIAVSAASGDTAMASAVASIIDDNASSGALSTGSIDARLNASQVRSATGGYETRVLVGVKQ